MKKKKVEIIDKSTERIALGGRKQKEPFYHLIAEKPDGQKIAFGVDQAGK